MSGSELGYRLAGVAQVAPEADAKRALGGSSSKRRKFGFHSRRSRTGECFRSLRLTPDYVFCPLRPKRFSKARAVRTRRGTARGAPVERHDELGRQQPVAVTLTGLFGFRNA